MTSTQSMKSKSNKFVTPDNVSRATVLLKQDFCRLSYPSDIRLFARDGWNFRLGVPDDDGCNGHGGGGKAKHILAIRRIEEGLRKADPTSAQPGCVRG